MQLSHIYTRHRSFQMVAVFRRQQRGDDDAARQSRTQELLQKNHIQPSDTTTGNQYPITNTIRYTWED